MLKGEIDVFLKKSSLFLKAHIRHTEYIVIMKNEVLTTLLII